jgi:hypothetical protein
MRRKPSFGLGLLGGFPLRRFVGAFTQGVTLDMVGIFPMCWSIRFNNNYFYYFILFYSDWFWVTLTGIAVKFQLTFN